MKIEIKIPTQLADLNLGAYQKYSAWLNNNKEAKEITKAQKKAEYFCGLNLQESYDISVKDCFEISDNVDRLLLETPETFATTFQLNGVNFGMIPDFNKMTMGEYANIDEYFGNINTFHRAFAVLYRPIATKEKKKYTIEKYTDTEKTAELMKDLSMEVVFGALLFFWSLNNEYTKSIFHSLSQNSQIQEVLNILNLGTNTDGTPVTTQSVMEAVLEYNRRPSLTFTKD